jgi:dolichol-phosphate mannosyltransferase
MLCASWEIPLKAIAVVPTYNEIENLPRIVELIRARPGGWHILVVDDGSPDGTGRLADELSLRYPGELFVLHRTKKEGLGRAYVAGFQWVLARPEYEIIVQMDADLSHDPEYLEPMAEMLKNHDLVLGSRYLNGISVVNWDFKRLLLSKGASLYVRIVTGMPYSDATGGYKAWRRDALASVGLDRLFSNGYLFQIETTYRLHRLKKFRIGQTSIIFRDRDLGRSKIDLPIILEAVWGVIRLRLTGR